MVRAIMVWRVLFMQVSRTARCFAFDNAGSNMAARMAMIAMTTSSSINVNLPCGPERPVSI